MSSPTPISATVQMNASPEEVWKVVSDLARMPEFSPELRKAFVVGKPGVGANIIGINRRKAVVWPTTSKVVRWEPGRAVAWKTRESGATWVYELEPTGGSTSVTGRRVLPRFTFGTSARSGHRRCRWARHRARCRHPYDARADAGGRRGVTTPGSRGESAVGEHGWVARGIVAADV